MTPPTNSDLTHDSLGHQYRIIGAELLRYEKNHNSSRSSSLELFDEFKVGVSFVPVEVLESYLEDLLDLAVSEESLWIRRDFFRYKSLVIASFGLLLAIFSGLYAATFGASLMLSLALTVVLAIPFALLWQFYPREGLARRIGFAQIVSHEIARRRGSTTTGDAQPIQQSTGILRDILSPRVPRGARGTAFRVH